MTITAEEARLKMPKNKLKALIKEAEKLISDAASRDIDYIKFDDRIFEEDKDLRARFARHFTEQGFTVEANAGNRMQFTTFKISWKE